MTEARTSEIWLVDWTHSSGKLEDMYEYGWLLRDLITDIFLRDKRPWCCDTLITVSQGVRTGLCGCYCWGCRRRRLTLDYIHSEIPLSIAYLWCRRRSNCKVHMRSEIWHNFSHFPQGIIPSFFALCTPSCPRRLAFPSENEGSSRSLLLGIHETTCGQTN